ncbi:hypothetical protein KM043_009438 [Ampulex compressa]|nr:hypothetical protein KM043_009438 [Ampulex compressa]
MTVIADASAVDFLASASLISLDTRDYPGVALGTPRRASQQVESTRLLRPIETRAMENCLIPRRRFPDMTPNPNSAVQDSRAFPEASYYPSTVGLSALTLS